MKIQGRYRARRGNCKLRVSDPGLATSAACWKTNDKTHPQTLASTFHRGTNPKQKITQLAPPGIYKTFIREEGDSYDYCNQPSLEPMNEPTNRTQGSSRDRCKTIAAAASLQLSTCCLCNLRRPRIRSQAYSSGVFFTTVNLVEASGDVEVSKATRQYVRCAAV